MSDFKETLTNAATKLRKGANSLAEDLQACAQDACSSAAEELKSRTKQTWSSVQDGTDQAVRKGTAYLLDHPWSTVLTAFGAGLALGLCLHRREPSSLKNR